MGKHKKIRLTNIIILTNAIITAWLVWAVIEVARVTSEVGNALVYYTKVVSSVLARLIK